MKKKTAAILLLLGLQIGLAGQDYSPVVLDIAFIKSKRLEGPYPPQELAIGIELARKAYYKLWYKDNVIKAGLLNAALNIINIPADHLFKQSGIHIYRLDLKAGNREISKEIEMEVYVDQEEIGKQRKEEEVRNLEYRVSLYIGDRLISSSQKKHYEKIAFKIKLPPMPYNYDPNFPEKKDPLANSFSIFTAIGLAYQLARGIEKKLNPPKKPTYVVQRKKAILATFKRRDSRGVEQEVQASLKLSFRDVSELP
jgi:hypothetical protein